MIIYHCSSGIEADRGPCMLFGWIGGGGGDDDDSYTGPGHRGSSGSREGVSMRDLFVVLIVCIVYMLDS